MLLRRLRSWSALLCALAIGALLALIYSHLPAGPLIDERTHYPQILLFKAGRLQLVPELTNIPGYHLLLALPAILFNASSLEFFRICNLSLSVLTIAIFAVLAGRYESGSVPLKTLQFALFPILLPFFGLVYVDILSLLLVCLGLYFHEQRRRHGAQLALILSVLVRQSNIVWLVFVWLLDWREDENRRTIVQQLKRSPLTVLALAAFAAFVAWNGGVAMGDQAHHPPFSLHTGNLFFILFCFFFLFAPLNVQNISAIPRLLRRRSMLLLLAATTLLYLCCYIIDSPLNLFRFHLRNKILLLFQHGVALWLIYLVLCLYALLSLAATPLARSSLRLLYPATVIFLAPSWTIEQRYYLVPFTLFMLFRRNYPLWVEISTLVFYAALSWLLFVGMAEGLFFI